MRIVGLILEEEKKAPVAKGPVQSEYVCDICGKEYKTETGLNNHIKKIHKGAK